MIYLIDRDRHLDWAGPPEDMRPGPWKRHPAGHLEAGARERSPPDGRPERG